MSPENTERTLQLGRLGRTIGLDGGLLFHAAGAAEAELLQVGLMVTASGETDLRIAALRRHNRGVVLHFEGIRRVERARELTNADLSVRVADLPEGFTPSDLAAGLIGLPVRLAGNEIGRVAAVEGAPGHEYLRLEPAGQLVPLNAPYVQVSTAHVALLDPPEGLL